MMATRVGMGRWVSPVALAVAVALLGVVAWGAGTGLRAAGVSAEADGDVILAQEGDGEAADDGAYVATDIEVTYDVFLARDPFESIRPPEPVATDPETGEPTDPSNGDPGSTDPSKDPVCQTGSEAVCNGTVLELQQVAGATALVEVNGIAFQTVPGMTFANNFQLLRVDDDCAEFLYLSGDEADTFTLCVGGVVAK